MTKLFMVVALIASAGGATAQTTERVVVRAGEDISPAISPNGHYRFARFTEAVVTWRNGTISRTRVNLHVCNAEMQFINAKGDTLAFAQAELIDHITVGADKKFIYSDKVCYELVSELPAVKLGKFVKVRIANDKKTAFGQSDLTGSQLQVGELIYEQRTVALNYDVEVRKTTGYFWIDSKNNVLPANRKNSTKLVDKNKQSKLQAFIDESQTNFNNEEDLRKLMAYVAGL